MPLAPYATHASRSRGRLVIEAASPTRGPYQRDRDRIIHSGAFRRLRNKTQVFIDAENDYFRTRLTHSLEVAQLARAMARQLQVDEDLAEATALAHDLGHTCFGHAGEDALDEAMRPHGAFDHNEQTFRILTLLERRYAAFNGLNLSWEMLEGVVKHNGPAIKNVPPTIAEFQKQWDLELGSYAGIEAQLAALSDDIAYNTHDFDDGFRAGFFTLDELEDLPLFGKIYNELKSNLGAIEDDRLMHEIVREVIGTLVQDVLAETRMRLAKHKPQSADDIRALPQSVVAFSAEVNAGVNQLRRFLMDRVYRHPQIKGMTDRAGKVVKSLYQYHFEDPQRLPPDWYADIEKRGLLGDKGALARHVGDYIAGMTDRYAELEYRRVFEG